MKLLLFIVGFWVSVGTRVGFGDVGGTLVEVSPLKALLGEIDLSWQARQNSFMSWGVSLKKLASKSVSDRETTQGFGLGAILSRTGRSEPFFGTSLVFRRRVFRGTVDRASETGTWVDEENAYLNWKLTDREVGVELSTGMRLFFNPMVVSFHINRFSPFLRLRKQETPLPDGINPLRNRPEKFVGQLMVGIGF